MRETVERWVRELAIRIGQPSDAVSTLSGGNQQRVVLAKWLTTEPRLLILDCPTVGVDVGARAGVFAIVRRLAEAGLAILLISDEVPEVYFNSRAGAAHGADGRHRRRAPAGTDHARGAGGAHLCLSGVMRSWSRAHPTESWLLLVLVRDVRRARRSPPISS